MRHTTKSYPVWPLNVLVVMVPVEKERREREAFYHTTTSDSGGQFTFKTVAPGEYRVYAWEEAEYGSWMDPDFLMPQEGRGEAVSVREGDRQAIQVTLIPADARVLNRFGGHGWKYAHGARRPILSTPPKRLSTPEAR